MAKKKKKTSLAPAIKKTSLAAAIKQTTTQIKKASSKTSTQKSTSKNTSSTKKAAAAIKAAAKVQATSNKVSQNKKKEAAQKVAQASLQLTKMQTAKKRNSLQTTTLHTGKNKNSLQATKLQTTKKKTSSGKKSQSWRDKLRADGKQAVAKAKQTDALGVKIKEKSYKTDTGMSKALAKTGGYAKAYGDAYKELGNEKEYGKLSDKQKKQIIKEYMPEAKAAVDKEVNKTYPDKLSYRNLTSDEYLRLQTAERMPSAKAKNAALGTELSKTVGSLNTAALKKGKAASGVMEGLNPLPVSLDKMGSGTYSEAEKIQNRKSKDSTAYKAGYMLGQAGSYFLGGGLGAGESGVAKAVLKKMGAKQTSKALAKGAAGKSVQAGAKTGLKVTGKGTAKKLVRGELDDATRAMISTASKNASKTAGKNGTTALQRFAAGRVADAAISSPLNASDAIKSATDENGKVNWKSAGANFALNTGLDLAVGGGLDIGTKAVSKLTSKDMQKVVKILAKQKSGTPLSEAESKFLSKAVATARNTVADREAKQAVEELRAKQNESIAKAEER